MPFARSARATAASLALATLLTWGCGERPSTPEAARGGTGDAVRLVAPAAPPAEIVAPHLTWGADVADPAATFWGDVPAVLIPMMPQVIVQPMHLQPAVAVLSVRIAHDGETIAARLEWDDPTESYIMKSDAFGDQVAVQFPLWPAREQPPSPMMGHVGSPVRILQWRSSLQWELENGRPTIQALYPNAVVDFYPDSLPAGQVGAIYTTGRAVGNPVAQPRLLSPVVAQVAEGWGTLTDAQAQVGRGRGHWIHGRWTVTIAQPLVRGEHEKEGLRAGSNTLVGFAVWEGGNAEVGCRKAWATWVPLRIEP